MLLNLRFFSKNECYFFLLKGILFYFSESYQNLELWKKGTAPTSPCDEYEDLYTAVQLTFSQICDKSVALGKVY